MKVRCKVCKGYFEKTEIQYNLPIGKICSKQCLDDFNEQSSRTVSKPRSTLGTVSNTRRGKPKVPKDIPSAVRKSVLERDRARCRRCGKNRNLHLHHVVYKSTRRDHSENNLITLCDDCHISIIHSNKKYYQPLLQELIELGNQGRFLTLIQLERLKENDDEYL